MYNHIMKFIYPGFYSWQNIITLFEFYSNKLERCYGYSCSTHASLYDPRFSTALGVVKLTTQKDLFMAFTKMHRLSTMCHLLYWVLPIKRLHVTFWKLLRNIHDTKNIQKTI